MLAWLFAGSLLLTGCATKPPSPTTTWHTTTLGLCEDYPEETRSLEAAREDLKTVQHSGAGVLRIAFGWDAIEPERGHYDWSFWDDFVRMAVDEFGIRLIPYVCYTPQWAATEAGEDFWRSPPRDPEDFARFMMTLVGRYKHAIHSWELWNEPDNSAYWLGTREQFAALVRTGSRAVRAADPNHVIILPGHSAGIGAYGKPSEHGMKNVALEMHFYPGHFGWSKPGAQVHGDWLQCAGGKGMCEWKARLAPLDTPFFVGEFQPWAQMGPELGGQVTRATYDAYVAAGWATAAWTYKIVTNDGGQGKGTWGLVTNARGSRVPKIDFNTAPLADIERLFRQFGSVPYEPQQAAMRWMQSATPPAPFAGLSVPSSSPTTSP